MPKATIAGSATFEVVLARLLKEADALEAEAARLDAHRKDVFGAVGYSLLQGDKITTAHACIPQDMTELGQGRFLFGFNVSFGLVDKTTPSDVFAVYRRNEQAGTFHEDEAPEMFAGREFLENFDRLYRVYQRVTFAKFSETKTHLYMVFRTGEAEGDLAVFKWRYAPGGRLEFADGRAEADYRASERPSHHFAWRTPDRDSFRYGDFPHVSIENRVFVDCTGGDLTLKIEDNTSTGAGIYAEPVEDAKQKIDDAEISYAVLGHLVLLRIRPYKERAYRYFIFNDKLDRVERVDSIGDSCTTLPEDQGLIFPDGTYLATGELKLLGSSEGHRLERVLASPNGEDHLYVFYSRGSGEYVLLPYRSIERRVLERITCHGFCVFPDGQMLLFRATSSDPDKHHSLQLRQTPFYDTAHEPPGRKDEFLYGVGNREAVRCLAELHEILALARSPEPHAQLYTDLVRRCGGTLDAHPWLGSLPSGAGEGVSAAVGAVRVAADQAVDEFDNVLRLRREAEEKTASLEQRAAAAADEARRGSFSKLEDFASLLGTVRSLAGEAAALKEAPGADSDRIGAVEENLTAQNRSLSERCVAFLLGPDSLAPYRGKAEGHLRDAGALTKVSEAEALERAVAATSSELETLVETLNALPIEDATETTRILDAIAALYTTLNQARGEIRNLRRALGEGEARAKFAAAMRLLAQSTASYLDLCDTPAKCDESLARVGAQMQEMEGAFAEFEEYIAELAEKREEITRAFDQRRTSLVEARAKRAGSVHAAAERLLKIIETRLAALEAPEAIAAYLVSDPIPAKVRDSAKQLLELEDPVKADDLSTRLKTLGQTAARQLKDRQELFADGGNVIRIGRHAFNVSPQSPELTVVARDGGQFLHITGTRFFQAIEDPAFLATRDVWGMEVPSEDASVYRGEFLAHRFLETSDLRHIAKAPPEEILTAVSAFMAGRYQEGYTRGIHDLDAAQIASACAAARAALGLAALPPGTRAAARVFWSGFCAPELKARLEAFLVAARERLRVIGQAPPAPPPGLETALAAFLDEHGLFEGVRASDAAAYLTLALCTDGGFTQTGGARDLEAGFRAHLDDCRAREAFDQALGALEADPAARLRVVRDWLGAFAPEEARRWVDEAAASIFCRDGAITCEAAATAAIEGLKGSHALIRDGRYAFDVFDFTARIDRFEREVLPRFNEAARLKSEAVASARRSMRLETFTPKVLTSFVRNRLIDEVYFPLVGDNLAKQMGAAGDAARTDRSGLLLLVSPPGYGKTTLLEYLASRLGLLFVKINGPALGTGTRSLDPEEAPNASAREEVERLNFALEMGDNLLLCVDDIQHCSSEFLQKFISLCDAQRKIEGVWRGRPKTHDFRGRKVVVAMAGNPYTETGQKFRIPDMLSNRADTYNLGDIVGGHARAFKDSYIENAATSNAVLARVANKSQHDLRAFLELAESKAADAAGRFEGSYSAGEVEDILGVLRKLLVVRDAVLAVNLEYIRSAAQSDEFRTEPPFKLQGSYRNMNRLAEKILPAHTDPEVRAILLDHYQNESQTLTADAEANLLKLRELWNLLDGEQVARWEDIKTTFRRNQISGREDDPAARVAGQIRLLSTSLESSAQGVATAMQGLGESVVRTLATEAAEATRVRNVEHELEMVHATIAAVQDLAIQQRDALERARGELARRADQGVVEFQLTDDMLRDQAAFLEGFQRALERRRTQDGGNRAANKPDDV